MSSSILPCLKNTFGDIPSMVCENVKYLTYNESREEFTCILCDKVMQKTCPSNLEAHLKSVSHRDKSCSKEEVTRALTITFQVKIPQIVQINIDLLDVLDEGYECVICDKVIKVSKDPLISVDNFSYHLTSAGHKENLEDYDGKIDQLRDVYGAIPQVIENNKEFLQLDRFGKNYVCTLCNVLLKVNRNNIERTKQVFEEHFDTPQHLWGRKRSKVLSLIPELQQSKSEVHTYLIRNIDYISVNGTTAFFCSLCNENIKRNIYDINETEENLKCHILSSDHEENLFSRQNQDNVKLENLRQLVGVFTDEVLRNLRYLELSDSSLSCSICDEEIYTESDCDEFSENIFFHFESDSHQNNISDEELRQTALIENLENEFGKIPPSIEENLAHIEFVQGNRVRCTLCDAILLSRNLERHLSTYGHTQAKEYAETDSESLHEDLEDLLGPDYKDKIPECIYNNWSHIEIDSDTGNFSCILCDDTILVDEGNKQEEITLQNFKRHLLSVEHTTKLKQKAKKEMETLEKLEEIFGGIPKCILSNVHYLHEKDEDSFSCDMCNVEIRLGSSTRTSKQNFLQHLRGSLHRSNIEDIETSIDNAFEYLDEKFCVPEFLLRDIDFWDNSAEDQNLYCTLCQQVLSVDLDDLNQTRRSLECHVNSDLHESNLEDF